MAQFTNRAQLSYNNETVSSNVATGEILEILSASKVALSGTYGADGSVTYVVSAVNTGTTPITGVSVSDDLGAYPFGTSTLYPLTYEENAVRLYVNGILQPAPIVTVGPPVVFSGITIPAGGSMVLVYEAQVNSYAPQGAGDTIVNTATVTANGISTPITASATITTVNDPVLGITKSVEPSTVAENGTITYTFLIQNYGNEEAAATANVTVTDTFDPVLEGITVTLNGAPLAEGTGYTYAEASGQFATVPSVITVPAATYAQDPVSGEWTTTPGSAVLTVSGTI